MSVTVTWNPEAVLQAMTRRAEAAMELAGAEFLDAVQTRTPVRSGRLRDGWEVIPAPDRVAIHIINDLIYASIIEDRRHMLAETLAEFAPRFAQIVARGMNG
jgi:hypothetical protein